MPGGRKEGRGVGEGKGEVDKKRKEEKREGKKKTIRVINKSKSAHCQCGFC